MKYTTITIESGNGGEESNDFASKLARMYMDWAKRDKLAAIHTKTKVAIEGDYRDLLIGHCGVHRLVRISPYDTAHRRHTSFCKVTIEGMAEYVTGMFTISYVFTPYRKAINHLLGIETELVEEVLAGKLALIRYYRPDNEPDALVPGLRLERKAVR